MLSTSILGNSLDTSIVYTRKGVSSYNNTTGEYITVDTNYTIKVPIEFVQSTEESGFQENVARLYITPDLIGDNQPLLQDEVTLTFSGSTRGAKITAFSFNLKPFLITKNLFVFIISYCFYFPL